MKKKFFIAVLTVFFLLFLCFPAPSYSSTFSAVQTDHLSPLSTAAADSEIAEEDEVAPELLPALLSILLLLTALIIFLGKRKHILVIDPRTGKSIEKKKIEIKPTSRIDLSSEYQDAYENIVRVRFLKSVRKRLRGCRVLFIREGRILKEIPSYMEELEITVEDSGEDLRVVQPDSESDTHD